MNPNGSALQVNGRENLWSRAVAMETGIQVASCYQCMRCSNSCPVSTNMDIKPHQVVRMVQLGQRERLLECSSIWICLSCEMCSTYCPNEIDVAGLMNHLKNLVVSSQKKPAEIDIATFHEVFLNVLQTSGRINDLQLMRQFRWKGLVRRDLPARGEMMKDFHLAMDLLKRKRLKLFPERSGATGEVRRIFEQYGRKGVSS